MSPPATWIPAPPSACWRSSRSRSTLGKTVLMVTHDNTLAMRAQRKLVISDGELVNEWLSRAFPNLSHNTLLKLSHAASTAMILRR